MVVVMSRTSKEDRLGTDRRPGPAAGGRRRQGRAAHAGSARPCRCTCCWTGSAPRSSSWPRAGPRSTAATARWPIAVRGSIWSTSASPRCCGMLAEGVVLPERPTRGRREKRPFPEWAKLVPGVIWIYDFMHFGASKRCAVAVINVVSGKWLATVVSAQESSTQAEVAFTPRPRRRGQGAPARRGAA